MYRGFIKLWRKCTDTKFYPVNENRRFTKWEAWEWLILNAYGGKEPKIIRKREKDFQIKRGQIITTQRQLANLWKWGLGTVNLFFGFLKHERYIEQKNERWFMVITIVNYEIYNPLDEQKNEQKNERKMNGSRTEIRTLYKEYNKYNKKKLNKKKKYINIKKKKFLDFVFLTEDEKKKLDKILTPLVVKDYINRLNNYIGSQGRRYRSHYHTILAWHRKDKPNESIDRYAGITSQLEKNIY